ncbi:MAG: hypothetical protein Q4A61_04875 [Porphyromonadaceae bacterium]|nr:hypothetical protein [Porphyromonadaceae bacterium]
MTTKSIVWVMLAVLASVVFSRCGQTDPTIDGGDTEENRYFYDYIFGSIMVPSQLKIKTWTHPVYDKELNTPRTKLFLEFDGEVYSDRRDTPAVPKPLEEFRTRVGDVYRVDYYESYRPGGEVAIGLGIAALSVEAVDDYSTVYKAGASLAPITEVTYFSWDIGLAKLILGERKRPIDLEEKYTRMLSDGIEQCRVPFPSFIKFNFLEAPSQPRVKLRFVVTFDNGSQLECTEEVEIREMI